MEVKTIAVAVLGAHVDDGGLGDNEGERFEDKIVECPGSLKYLYDEHYEEGGNWDEVRIELVERTHIDRLTAELAALQSRLNETDAENDRLRQRVKWVEGSASELEGVISSLRDMLPQCKNCGGCGQVDDGHSSFDCWVCSGTGALENKHEQQ